MTPGARLRDDGFRYMFSLDLSPPPPPPPHVLFPYTFFDFLSGYLISVAHT